MSKIFSNDDDTIGGREKGRNATKPKNVVGKKERPGSKTAPIESDFTFGTEGEDPNEYISSYNYYIYYHSIKPKDPRLPKPTYKPMADMDFIKHGNLNLNNYDNIREEDEHNSDNLEDDSNQSSGVNTMNNMNNLGSMNTMNTWNNVNSMMENLNLGEKPLNQVSGFNGNFGDVNSLDAFTQSYLQSSGMTGMGSKNLNMRSLDYYGPPSSGYASAPSNFNAGLLQVGTLPQTINSDYSNLYQQEEPIPNMNLGFKQGGGRSKKTNKQQQTSQVSQNPYGNYFGSMKQPGFENLSSYNFSNQNQNQNLNLNQNSNMYNNFFGGNVNTMMNMNNSGNIGNIGNVNSYNFNPMYTNPKNINKQQGMMNMNMNSGRNDGGLNYFATGGMGNMNLTSSMNMMNNMNMPGMNNMNTFGNFNMGGNFKSNNNKGYNNNNTYPGNFGGFNTSLNKETNVYNNPMYQMKKDRMGIDTPTFDEIVENVVDFSKDHSGSRLVQKKFEDANEEDREKLFSKLSGDILNLSKDVFGNYVIQKILEYSNNERNKIIVSALEGKIYELSLHMYGCRVIQKLIDVSENDEVKYILGELRSYFSTCIEDQNGNHVMQKLIEKLPPGEHVEIMKVVCKRVYELSIHQYGCRVMQKLFEFCTEDQKECLLKEIYASTADLCQDQYGNYVIQHVLEKRGGENVPKIYEFLKGKIFDMSIHKFASNVIEKCLSQGSALQRRDLIDEIISKDDIVHDSLLAMVKDKFGNYVVQKMIEYSDQKTKENIIKRIISSQSLKKRDGFSKHVISFIEKMGFSAGSINMQK